MADKVCVVTGVGEGTLREGILWCSGGATLKESFRKHRVLGDPVRGETELLRALGDHRRIA